MRFERACIPLGYIWSSPFARWQGPLADIPTVDLAADVTSRALQQRNIPASEFAALVMGCTIPQVGLFYGAPTLAGLIGAPGLTGPMISQACATGVATAQAAALQVEVGGGDELVLAVTADRLSNSPLLVFPSASAVGGSPTTEHWLLGAMAQDPWAQESMLSTAERTAADGGITRQELDDLTLLRFEQYQRGLADDRSFQRSYMIPVHVPGKKETVIVEADTGVHQTTAEGLGKLAPVTPDGVITYGTQTHPADAAAGLVVTTESRARELGDGVVRILGIGFARVSKAEMPKAAVPAANNALSAAGLTLSDVDLVTTHNPFAVNDVWFNQQTGFPTERMNSYGCSLIYGHPHSATATRAIAELIQALHERGGGVGLFTGCAAGDTGDAIVVRVED